MTGVQTCALPIYLVEAVRAAKDYITGAIAASSKLEIGSGHGPVHHFYRWW